MKYKLLLFLVVVPLASIGFFACRSLKGRSVPVATSPEVVDSPVAVESVPAVASGGVVCSNWGSATSGSFWGYDSSGQLYEGRPLRFDSGFPVFSSSARVF